MTAAQESHSHKKLHCEYECQLTDSMHKFERLLPQTAADRYGSERAMGPDLGLLPSGGLERPIAVFHHVSSK